tara:strand:- start:20879 stop:21505 length:627 start_codon:yes stop_codon:yes gene_type:complete
MKFKNKLKYNSNLAEIVGIMLGDGCLYKDYKNKYHSTVTFHKNEVAYKNYVKKLFEEYFGYKFYFKDLKFCNQLTNVSVFVGEQFLYAKLKVGSKLKYKATIPEWIFKRKLWLKCCIRGIFDTDGCVYRKYDYFKQIQIKFACLETTQSVHRAFLLLGFKPTRIQKGVSGNYIHWKFYLSKQQEIDKFFTFVQPRNKKHVDRYLEIVK